MEFGLPLLWNVYCTSTTLLYLYLKDNWNFDESKFIIFSIIALCEIQPIVRGGKDHAHMAPKLINHLNTHNFEDMPDPWGRRNADFYRNFIRQTKDEPAIVRRLNKHL